MLSVIGWIAWVVVAYLALTFAYGFRRCVATGRPLMKGTVVRMFFWWVIVVVFLFTSFNKLHIVWLAPIGWWLAEIIVLPGIPILTPLILVATHLFFTIMVIGVKRDHET